MKTLLLFATLLLAPLSYSESVKVLIISGLNNHDWRSTTPVIERFLEASGEIEVTITEEPHLFKSCNFEDFDVIVSNWNSFPKAFEENPKLAWSQETKDAYSNFVRNGGGHVVIHAGSTSFYDWEDYFDICLMRWGKNSKNKYTSHGEQHSFPIRIEDPQHPAIKGIEISELFDELWRNPEIHRDATVLASSFSGEPDGGTQDWEPCVIVGQFGKGRCFSTTLGHGAESLSDPDLQKLIIQGVLWTATR